MKGKIQIFYDKDNNYHGMANGGGLVTKENCKYFLLDENEPIIKRLEAGDEIFNEFELDESDNPIGIRSLKEAPYIAENKIKQQKIAALRNKLKTALNLTEEELVLLVK